MIEHGLSVENEACVLQFHWFYIIRPLESDIFTTIFHTCLASLMQSTVVIYKVIQNYPQAAIISSETGIIRYKRSTK